MSVQAIQWALRTEAPSAAAKLVLVVLADSADERGECWPTIPALLKATQLSETAVRDHINKLRDSGLITDRPGSINRNKRVFTLALRPE
jgi:pyocin large subunit-like protein